MRTIKFPSYGTVFDYFIDPGTKKFTSWTERVPDFHMIPDIPLQVCMNFHQKQETLFEAFLSRKDMFYFDWPLMD